MKQAQDVFHRIPAAFRQRRWWIVLLVFWAGSVWLILQMHLDDIRNQSVQIATEGARNMFRMVVLTRSWNASHGGVYVPVTPRTQPNLYLDVKRRDVTTTDGQQLTLINPAYMTRLIAEMAITDSGSVFRLTSLRPIRPENAADAWEKVALQTFEQGNKEFISITDDVRGRQLRYMAPLRVEEPCLQCHAKQGYKLGDVRGGISVSQLFAPIEATTLASVRQTQFNYFGVFLVTAAMAWLLLELLRRRWLELAAKIDELEATRSELIHSEKMASLGRMVAGFAHEINTPVGVAVGAVSHSESTVNRLDELLSQEEVTEEALRGELEDLRQSGALAMANLRRAAHLVQSFKRTSVDQGSEQVRPFDLRELIDDVLFALNSQLKKMPVEVKVDCVADLRLLGKPGLVQQLLTNLLLNSMVHGFDGGKLAGKIAVHATYSAGNLHMVFSDDGRGIAPEVLDHIFEPFYTTRRGSGGSGLGLYICYNIVATQLGGNIQCSSTLQQGCKFEIRFPATLAEKDKQVPT